MNNSDAFRSDGISKALNSMVKQMQDGGRILRDARTATARSNRYRKARHHRARLIDSGDYIYTSERGQGLMQFISKPPPEYKPEPWPSRGSWAAVEYVRSHHSGAALWMPSESGSRHWPGCGCP